MPKLKLYHYWRSSSSWRVRWALAIKGLECEFVAVSLLDGQSESPEHRARNPQGFVPVLEVDGKPLTQSLAILDWLEETFPQNSLYPKDPWLKAKARSLAQIIACDTQPIQNPPVFQMHSQDPAEQKRWNQHWIRTGLESYEQQVRETAGQYSVGDQLTVADLCLIPQCYNALRFEVSLDAYPTIARIHQNATRAQTCQASAPDKFEPL